MVVPVLLRRPLAGQGGQAVGHEAAERLARQVDIGVAALGEIHRHIQRIVGIALIAEAVAEDEVQHPCPVRIGVGPDIRARAEEAVGLSFRERTTGEQGGGDRLQGQRCPEFGHHVGLVREVQIRLDGAGAQHHVEAELALLRHIVPHDDIAALGHDRHFLAPPHRIEARAEEAEVQLVGDLFDLHQMLAGLVADVVHILQRRAGQFELPARLQRDRRRHPLVVLPFQGDDIAGLLDGAPAEPLQPRQHRQDAGVALIGRAAQGRAVEAEFLVLRPDAPLRLRLGTLRHGADQVVPGKRRSVGHAFSPVVAARWEENPSRSRGQACPIVPNRPQPPATGPGRRRRRCPRAGFAAPATRRW